MRERGHTQEQPQEQRVSVRCACDRSDTRPRQRTAPPRQQRTTLTAPHWSGLVWAGRASTGRRSRS
eukprot:2771312-Rhodomonas_salina.1